MNNTTSHFSSCADIYATVNGIFEPHLEDIYEMQQGYVHKSHHPSYLFAQRVQEWKKLGLNLTGDTAFTAYDGDAGDRWDAGNLLAYFTSFYNRLSPEDKDALSPIVEQLQAIRQITLAENLPEFEAIILNGFAEQAPRAISKLEPWSPR